MRPLVLTIRQPFFDTQLYMGRLYGWCLDGSVATYDWNRLLALVIDRLGPDSRLPLECGFRRGDYLYGKHWELLFRDEEIRNVIMRRFERWSEVPIEIENRELESSFVGRQDSPMPFPHADSVVFKRKLYTAGAQGIHVASCNKRTRKPVSTRTERRWDCPAFGLAKSRYWGLAIAAGEEGVFEYHPDRIDEPTRSGNGAARKARDCTLCEWMYFSLYGSSHNCPGFMLEFGHNSTRSKGVAQWETEEPRRKFIAELEPDSIFEARGPQGHPGGPAYTWGAHDKICRLANRQIEVVRFNPWSLQEGRPFEQLTSVEVMETKGEFVSAQTALFGFIVEFDNCLVIIESASNQPLNRWGEPVNWRVFRHSKFYANQLHVAYHDRLEVLSFNQDYFSNQETKVAGYRYSASAAT